MQLRLCVANLNYLYASLGGSQPGMASYTLDYPLQKRLWSTRLAYSPALLLGAPIIGAVYMPDNRDRDVGDAGCGTGDEIVLGCADGWTCGSRDGSFERRGGL